MPKILGGKLPGKIGRRRHSYSSLAQSVEHAAVNRRVVGSSPTGGAKKIKTIARWSLFFCFHLAASNQLPCVSTDAFAAVIRRRKNDSGNRFFVTI